MDNKLVEACQNQINEEFYSAYLYLAMSAWADNEGWKGFSHWFAVQEQEERGHAMFIHNQLMERGERSIMKAIKAPQESWESPLKAMEDVLEHEKYITSRINDIASISMEVKDHAMYEFIQILVKEQVEEEATASDIVTRLRRLDGHPAMLEAMDKELAARVPSPPISRK